MGPDDAPVHAEQGRPSTARIGSQAKGGPLEQRSTWACRTPQAGPLGEGLTVQAQILACGIAGLEERLRVVHEGGEHSLTPGCKVLVNIVRCAHDATRRPLTRSPTACAADRLAVCPSRGVPTGLLDQPPSYIQHPQLSGSSLCRKESSRFWLWPQLALRGFGRGI